MSVPLFQKKEKFLLQGAFCAGDVLELPIDDARVGYAQVIDVKRPNAPYLAVFARAYPRDAAPTVDEILADDIALLFNTMDALLRDGTWRVVGTRKPDLSRIPFPSFKVSYGYRLMVEDYRMRRKRRATAADDELLGYRTTSTAGVVQLAIEALHGAGEWLPAFDSHRYDEVKRRAR